MPPSEPECINRTPAKWEIVSPVKDAPLSMSDIEQKALRAKKRLFDSAHVNDIEEIVEKTKGQHETRMWFDDRQSRITASKSKRCLLRPTTRNIRKSLPYWRSQRKNGQP